MRGFSKVVLTGNLTRDIELRNTPNGATVGSFTVAVNRVYRDANGNNQEDVSFIDCTVWGRPAEVMNQYLHKGSPVLVSGRLSQHSWEDKNTSQKRSRVEVVVEDFQFLGSGNDSNRGGGSYSQSNYSQSSYNSQPAPEVQPDALPVDDSGEVVPEDIPEDLGSIDMGEVPF